MKISWIAKIKGIDYGSEIGLVDDMTNKEIADAVDIFAQDLKLTLQKIINGKTEIDELIEE